MKLLNILNKVIEYSFYLLFFLVPLALAGDTSELFEFNKLWVTFILTIIIAVAWGIKMVVKKEFRLQRTPLDIPIALFVASQILSTIFSLDMHLSLWGYYSRFNGGLLSILSYVFLYYAFVSNYKELSQSRDGENKINLQRIIIYAVAIVVFFGGNLFASIFRNSGTNLFPLSTLISLSTVLVSFAIFMKASSGDFLKRTLYSILSCALLVVLWGLPSHFGFDPTCLLFRGSFDVACWTADFQPKIRIFSTLGQPDWLGAYLAVIVPVLAAVLLNFISGNAVLEKGKSLLKNYNLLFVASIFALITTSYFSILWTLSRASVLGIWIALFLFILFYFAIYEKLKLSLKNLSSNVKTAIALVILVFVITFFNGQPFSFLNIFTLQGLQTKLSAITQSKLPVAKPTAPTTAPTRAELGGTDSGKIRLLVWEGAIDIWKNYPIFGSGLETYAYSYYKYRPVAHNLTSEWNFLYNKAHNEYLNYLATTGTVGIVSYLLLIATFLFISLKALLKNKKTPQALLVAALVSAYVGILITNFFGFSVVIINIFFFLIPAFVFVLNDLVDWDKNYTFSLTNQKKETITLTNLQKGLAIGLVVLGAYFIFVLLRFWQADRYYYLGYNYDRAGDYQSAYPYLQKAVQTRPSEPVFRDELTINNAIVASAIIYQNQQKQNANDINIAKQLIDSAIANSNKLALEHPNSIVYAKTRIRVFYTLSQVDTSYLPYTLDAIKKAQALAPTDPDISYNLGVVTGQTGDPKKAIEILQNTIKLKPDYLNAYYALGVFYHQLAVNDKGVVINADYDQKAKDAMKYILKTFGSYQPAQDALDTWSK